MKPQFPITTVEPGLVPSETYPPATRGEVVVWGFLAAYPFGGMTWQVLHHLVGLRRLGFDVWYVEDSDSPVFDPTTYWQVYDIPDHNIAYLRDAMAAIGMHDRWILRPPKIYDRCFGAGDFDSLLALYKRARAVFNVCGAQELLPHHDSIGTLVYLETDPLDKQVLAALGDAKALEILRRHDYLFTYGTNIGLPGCAIPAGDYTWTPTRPPVVVDWWATEDPPATDAALTSIANWRHKGKTIEWRGEVYEWRKDLAFEPFLDLPPRSPLPMELALGAIGAEECDALRQRGWRIVPSLSVGDPGPYLRYIRSSLGEFTAAKDQYTRTWSGWFSDRSVCYLAAGRPVITQDTGCGRWLPNGEGVLLFTTPDEAHAALEEVASDPERHRRAAFEIAREYFAAETVLGEVAARVGLL